MHFGGHGHLGWMFTSQFRAHRAVLITGMLVTIAYTGLVWWLCHPLVKQFDRIYRKPWRWRLYTPRR
jgi:hypothetical protein